MGLDMYLNANSYVSGYKHSADENRELYGQAVDLFKVGKAIDPETPSLTIEFTVAYWRKANAIHKWFVDNVQDGTDDCDTYDVTREQLAELRDLCRKAIEVAEIAKGQPVHSGTTYYSDGRVVDNLTEGRAILNGETVAEILPTQGGFFFGGTDYDEWYIQNLENTVAQLDRALANTPDAYHFTYHGSW